MGKISLAPLSSIDGYIGSTLVDSTSGMVLGSDGGGPVNMEIAAAGNTQVVRAKRKTMESLGIKDKIEDILITLNDQYHIIRPLESDDVFFLLVVLVREKANLAMARHEIKKFEKTLDFN